MMKQGADDYLLKDRLAELGTAVGNALEQRRLRKERADIEERKRAEQVLGESEGNYRQLFDGNPQPMWVCDRETLAIWAVNEVAVQTYGYTADEFLQMSVLDLRAPEGRAAVEAVRGAGGDIRRAEVWTHLRRDGWGLQADIVTRDLVFEGRPARLVMAIEVTERNAEAGTEASERRYRELTEGAPIGIYRTAPTAASCSSTQRWPGCSAATTRQGFGRAAWRPAPSRPPTPERISSAGWKPRAKSTAWRPIGRAKTVAACSSVRTPAWYGARTAATSTTRARSRISPSAGRSRKHCGRARPC